MDNEEFLSLNWELSISKEEMSELEAKTKRLPLNVSREVCVQAGIEFLENILEARKSEGGVAAGMILWGEENRKVLEEIAASGKTQTLLIDNDPTHYGIIKLIPNSTVLLLLISASEYLKVQDLVKQLKTFGIEVRSNLIVSAMIRELDLVYEEIKADFPHENHKDIGSSPFQGKVLWSEDNCTEPKE